MAQKRKMSREEFIARTDALHEPHFEGSELIMQIQPLMEDCFFGAFEFDREGLLCAFPNGQRFRIVAREIKEEG